MGASDGGVEPVADAGPCAFTEVEPPAPTANTPRWAFEPWISKDISTGADSYAFVDGFVQRNIPVGVLVLDSPWETNYNTFVPNPARYPAFAQMVSEFRQRGVRTVLWVTQMVNEESFDAEPGGDLYSGEAGNFLEGLRCGFYINNGDSYLWWKGTGSAVDFFNPAARAWWHAQQNTLLDLGVAGWKLDFGEQYITAPMLETAEGTKTLQQYSEAYYRDFLAHGLARRGADEFVTMVRPYDRSYQFAGRFFARPEHAPVAWVGDNRRDWVGLQDALDHIFRSANAGYVVLGSDIGGYLDRDDVDLTGPQIPFSSQVFMRWTAVGAMTPFMQLHGRANITPWTVPDNVDQTVTAYRYWAQLHHALVPFFYALAQDAYAGGPVIVRPVGEQAQWPGDYRFTVGNAFLVAPILDDTGVRNVALPVGSNWYNWWQPQDAPQAGGAVLNNVAPGGPQRIPLYVRAGAVVPVQVDGQTPAELGSVAQQGALTVLLWAGQGQFTVHLEDGSTPTVRQRLDASNATVEVGAVSVPMMLRYVAAWPVQSVTVEQVALAPVASRAALDTAAQGWVGEGAYVWVKLGPAAAERSVALRSTP